MKLRRLFWLLLAGSIAVSAKGLRDLWLLREAARRDPAELQNRLARMAQTNPAMEKLVSDQMKGLDAALNVDGGPPSDPGIAPAPAPPAETPSARSGPSHAQAFDTNSSGRARTVPKGGGVLVDASGRRYEIAPRPVGTLERVREAAPVLPRLPLPVLDSTEASPEARRGRALILLAVSAVSSVLLVLWARRFKP